MGGPPTTSSRFRAVPFAVELLNPAFRAGGPGEETQYRYLQGSSVLFNARERTLFSRSPPPPEAALTRIGSLGSTGVTTVALHSLSPAPPSFAPMALRELYGLVPDEELGCASRAVQLLEFEASCQFCGRCGTRTEPSTVEHARVCPGCGETIYPRLSPAVIVLVARGDECLLARSPRFPPGMYSAIAGFVEPGETIEHAVERELAEECGVRLRRLRYAGSQPWPFPHSLMLGFHAEEAGGELRVDGSEIEAADWFHRDRLPLLPSPGSIARRLIEEFVVGNP